MPIDWKEQAAQVDDIVNDVFGLDVQLLPWGPAMTDGAPDPYKVGGGADETREVRTIRGVYVSKETAMHTFPGMTSSDVVADMHVSVKSSDVGDLRKDDHVVIDAPPDPHPSPFSAELSYITPGDTGRSLLHLIKLKS